MASSRVLVLCTGNSARSVIAEALLRACAGGAFEVQSAGTHPKGINPFTTRVLVEERIPLEGFRSKAGWPFSAELRLVFDDEIRNWKLEFDFGEEARRAQEEGEPVDFSGQASLGPCPKCKGRVFEHGTSYVCENATGPKQTCDFKSGKIILQQPVSHEEVHKLLTTGKTSLLENFVSNKTRRKFKAYLAYDKKEGKVSFEFEPRAAKAPAKKAVARKAA